MNNQNEQVQKARDKVWKGLLVWELLSTWRQVCHSLGTSECSPTRKFSELCYSEILLRLLYIGKID